MKETLYMSDKIIHLLPTDTNDLGIQKDGVAVCNGLTGDLSSFNGKVFTIDLDSVASQDSTNQLSTADTADY